MEAVQYIRRQLDLLLVLLGLLVLLLDRLCCGTAATLCNLLLGCSGMLDRPLSCLVFEFSRVPDEHACDFSVLRVFRFGCAQERLERDEGGLDGQNGRPL